MAKNRRNRKLRRRERMRLKSGHEARHKLSAGRTGSVHHKKTRKFAEGDGVPIAIKLTPRFEKVEEVAEERKKKPVIVHTPRIVAEPVIAPEPQIEQFTEINPNTQVPIVEQAYGLCLAIQERLIEADFDPSNPGQLLLNAIVEGIKAYENRR